MLDSIVVSLTNLYNVPKAVIPAGVRNDDFVKALWKHKILDKR
jgi:hypothetical protein